MPASAPGEADPLAPVFFLSYKRSENSELAAAQNPDDYVLRFFNDLVDQLSPLVARRPGAEYGFIDRAMRGGQRWESQILDALGSCQVFVALVSAPYFRSDYCGKEWWAFSQRRIVRQHEGNVRFGSPIVPVVWAPNLGDREPAVVRNLQTFTPGPGYHEPLYLERGVHGLLATGREEAYKEVTWRLARHIANVFYTCRVEWREIKEMALRNVFRDEVP